MKRTLKIFTLTILLLTSFSCNKGKEIEGFYLSEEMKSQVPFQGYETITFVDEIGDTFVLSGDVWIKTSIEVPECINCNDYRVYEKKWINFNDDLYDIQIKLGASYQNYLSIKYTFDEIKFWCGFISPLSEENLEKQEIIIDSINVNNVMYYNVYKDTVGYHQGTIPLTIPYPVFFYYSIEYGLLKIDFSDNYSWELKNIEYKKN